MLIEHKLLLSDATSVVSKHHVQHFVGSSAPNPLPWWSIHLCFCIVLGAARGMWIVSGREWRRKQWWVTRWKRVSWSCARRAWTCANSCITDILLQEHLLVPLARVFTSLELADDLTLWCGAWFSGKGSPETCPQQSLSLGTAALSTSGINCTPVCFPNGLSLIPECYPRGWYPCSDSGSLQPTVLSPWFLKSMLFTMLIFVPKTTSFSLETEVSFFWSNCSSLHPNCVINWGCQLSNWFP